MDMELSYKFNTQYSTYFQDYVNNSENNPYFCKEIIMSITNLKS